MKITKTLPNFRIEKVLEVDIFKKKIDLITFLHERISFPHFRPLTFILYLDLKKSTFIVFNFMSDLIWTMIIL